MKQKTSPYPEKEENKKKNKDRERGLLVVLLLLLLSCVCIFCASQSSLSLIDRNQIADSMLSLQQADYGADVFIAALAPVDRDRIIDEIIKDNKDIESPIPFPAAGAVVIAALPKPIPQPTLIVVPSLPTPTPTLPLSVPIPTPTDSPATSQPSPPEPNVPSSTAPAATSVPTVPPTAPPTALPSPTVAPPTLPPPTLPPPTVPPPTEPPPTSPPPTSPPPTFPPPTAPPPTAPPPTSTPTTIPVNAAPVAVDDSYPITDVDIPLTISVLSNDFDIDGPPPLMVIAAGTPLSGTVVINPDYTVTYTPNLNIYGIDVFTYTISDSLLTATATVTVTVNAPPVAVDDTPTTAEDTPRVIAVLNNDSDPDGNPLTVISVGTPLNGTATLNVPGYTVSYTPNPNINGTDLFTYTISDGRLTDTATVTVTIIPINDAPVAMADNYSISLASAPLIVPAPGALNNDSDAESGSNLTAGLETLPGSGTLALNSSGAFTYTPVALGAYTFTYKAYDSGMTPSNTAVVTITVLP